MPPESDSGRSPHALPTTPGPLVGRERDVLRVVEQMRGGGSRLVTLTGIGGIGKTRLGLAIASALQDDMRDGARFVDLARCRDVSGVLSAILAAIEVQQSGRRPLLETLTRSLRRINVLLLLDNFEQVLSAAASIATLLAECPSLRVIVTSRAPLRIRWEHEYPVGPLQLPDPRRLADPTATLECAAVELLVQRLAAAGLSVATARADVEALAQICLRLDGIPLAIELAAARGRVLAPRALLERLSDLFKVLADSMRDRPDRHQTLRRTFDWSFDLLSAPDQNLFARLGVFVGGFTLSAAEFVSQADADSAQSSIDIVDGLQRLVESSLVRRVESTDADAEARFAMLEPVREYALDRLEAGGEASTIRDRHAQLFLDVAERAQDEIRGPRQSDWLRRLDAEHANCQSALRWYVSQSSTERSLRLAAALAWFWWVRGLAREGLERLGQVLTLSMLDPKSAATTAARAAAVAGAGTLAYQLGDFELAATHAREALAAFRALGNRSAIGQALNTLGNCALVQSDLNQAHARYEESLAVYQAADDRRGAGLSLTNLGLVAFERRDLAGAHKLLSQGVALAREAGDARGLALGLGALGLVCSYRGEFEMAWGNLQESLILWREVGERAYLPLLLEACAVLSISVAESERGLRIAAGAAALREDIEAPRPPIWAPELERWLDRARKQLGQAPSARAWAGGLALSADAAIAEALAARDGVRPAPRAPVPRPAGLTGREVEVLRLLASGCTNREIADQLVVTVGTVERHLANMYAKIEVRNRAEATAFAIAHKLGGAGDEELGDT